MQYVRAVTPERAAGREADHPEASRTEAACDPAVATATQALSAGTPDVQPAVPEQRQASTALAVLISLLLHGAALAWIVYQPPIETIGGGGQNLEAISIEVVTAAALESLSSKASASAAGAAGEVADTVGIAAPAQIETAAAAPTKLDDKPEPDRPPPPPPDVVAKPDPAPEADTPLTIAETQAPKAEPPINRPPDETPVKRLATPRPEIAEPKPETPPETVVHAASEAQPTVVTGGATTRATAERIEAEAAAGASPGELARYALAVRLALGRTRPPHAGIKGKVIVSFRLSLQGTVEKTDIHRTSGSAGLDRAALAAVHAAAFPLPPPGSTDAQRSYTVPFDFR